MRISEVKHHIDGRKERYTLTLVSRTPRVVVATYGFRRSYVRDGFRIPKGSTSHGFFWARRPYIMYRMTGPDGDVIAHRFDVVEDVRLEQNAVHYTDLLLDLWVQPDGMTHLEDEDEVEEARETRVISSSQARQIGDVGKLLLRRNKAIIREGVKLIS